MTHTLAAVFLLTSLVIGIPAVRKLINMRRIDRNGGVATGHVSSVRSSLGWLWTADFGNSTRSAIHYLTPKGTEMVLEVADSSMFTFRRYEPGMAVEVVYDQASPGEAYARPERDANLREFRLALAAITLAMILEIIARVYQI